MRPLLQCAYRLRRNRVDDDALSLMAFISDRRQARRRLVRSGGALFLAAVAAFVFLG